MLKKYCIDCGGEHNNNKMAIDGVIFNPTHQQREKIAISKNRKLSGDEVWFGNNVKISPEPFVSHADLFDHSPDTIKKTEYPELYKSEYWAPDEFSINFTVENGEYDVIVHLAEYFYATTESRVFTINVNNESVFKDFDIYNSVGFGVATKRKIKVKVTDNLITVDATSSVENPKISGIEIHPV